MNIDTLIKTLINNFRLDPHVAAVAKVMIDESGVVDFSGLMREILASKKFDFLSKLQDGIDKCKVVVELDDIENRKVYTYSEKIFKKTTDCFDEISFQGWDINSDQMTRFLNVWFDENESKVLEVIGDRHRLLFMTKNMRGALQEQISEIVYQLSINKKKSVLAIPMDKRSDGESRMLELLRSKNK